MFGVNVVEDGPNYKGIWLFGTDLNQIPCFRESFLQGFYGAAVGSVLGYIYKNRFLVAFKGAHAGFVVTTLYTWFSCRYSNYRSRKDWKEMRKNFEDSVETTGEYNIPNVLKGKQMEQDDDK